MAACLRRSFSWRCRSAVTSGGSVVPVPAVDACLSSFIVRPPYFDFLLNVPKEGGYVHPSWSEEAARHATPAPPEREAQMVRVAFLRIDADAMGKSAVPGAGLSAPGDDSLRGNDYSVQAMCARRSFE